MARMPIPLLMLLLLGSSAFAAPPNYVNAPPFSEVLAGTQVQNVRPQQPVQLPMITWGGDMATILANGNDARTRSGSLFGKLGLDLSLVRKDVFADQLKDYLAGRSPYLRGTLGMINMAAEALSKDPRTKPVVIYQMTWSAGGDALVVKSGIHSAKDLKGKTIALQAYGPHVDYLSKILADAGLTPRDVSVRWLPDLTGTDQTPGAALKQPDIDAALVITPDAMVLTSGGTIGTGAEDSVKGAKIMLSTRTANRIIADVYAVRSDYLNSNRPQVEALVRGLLQGQEALRALVAAKASRGSDYQATITKSAELLMDSPQASADVEGLYADAEFAGPAGNRDFFSSNHPRSIGRLSNEAQQAFLSLGLLSSSSPISAAGWDFNALQSGLKQTTSSGSRFSEEQVAAVVAKKQRQDTLGEGEIFSFEIFFQPNQNDFSADLYQEAFNKVIDLSATYGGALITIEGHSDPLGYLRSKKEGQDEVVLSRIKQSAKNLSLSRAVAVRGSIIDFAARKGITLDPTQFAVVGHGIAKPKSGVCGSDPCAPRSEKEWRDNMRVAFRVLQVEAESSVFKPL